MTTTTKLNQKLIDRKVFRVALAEDTEYIYVMSEDRAKWELEVAASKQPGALMELVICELTEANREELIRLCPDELEFDKKGRFIEAGEGAY